MKSSGAWCASGCVDSRPGLVVEIKLIYIIEAFLILVDTAKDEHRIHGSACRVSISTFDVTFHSLEL